MHVFPTPFHQKKVREHDQALGSLSKPHLDFFTSLFGSGSSKQNLKVYTNTAMNTVLVEHSRVKTLTFARGQLRHESAQPPVLFFPPHCPERA